MPGSQTLADWMVQFSKCVSSSLDSKTGVIQFHVAGVGAIGVDDSDDEAGDGDVGDVFASLGILARPLDQKRVGGKLEYLETVCLRTSDGLIPFAVRDQRIKMPGGGPNKGTIAFVGYGGGFHSLTPVNDGDDGTIHVIYCPYNYVNGVAQKAHAITLDPSSGNESISVVHAEGQSLLMQSDGSSRLSSPNGQSFVQVTDGGVTIQTPLMILNGGAVVIGNPTGGIVPLLPGAASPPCPRLFLNPAS